jgi:hypothetical protein
MMTSHGVVQGYNSQGLIDAKHQVIVHGEAFGNGQDHGQVNLKECQELGLDAYIPDRKFRNRDPRFATQKRRQVRRFTLQDFHYDEALDLSQI